MKEPIELKDNELYQKYKTKYAIYFGYLILSDSLSQSEIKLIENHYQDWELIKLKSREYIDNF